MSFTTNAVVLTGSDQTIFQAPAGTEGAIHGLVFNNSGPEVASLTLKFLNSANATTQIVLQNFTVPAGSQFTWPKPIDLASGDAVLASGSGLVALHSSFIQTAVPSAVGFVGRGEWTSIAAYNPNDVVSRNNNSYLANAANTNSAPPSANWTLLAAQGATGTIANTVRTPTAISPLTGGLVVNPVGPLEASEYAPLYSVNERLHRTFQVTTAADTSFASPVFSLNVNADSTLITPALAENTNFIWRCRDVSEEGIISDWMTTQSFLTKDYSVNTPTVTVEGAPSSVNQQPLITLSAYTTSPDQTATYVSTDWEVRRVSDNVLVYSSYNDTLNVSSITIPPGVLVTNTAYAFRARYNSTIYGSSAYGSTSATTLATYVQQLFPALPFVSNAVVTAPSGYPLKKAFAIDATRSIHIYQRTNNNSTLSPTGSRWYMAVVTNTANGPVTDATKHLLMPSTTQVNATPQLVMRTATEGYIIWGSTTTQQLVFANFTVSGDTITIGTQTIIGTSGTSQGSPTINKIRDDWYLVSYYYISSSVGYNLVITIEIVNGLPVVSGSQALYGGLGGYDIVSIGGDKAALFAQSLNYPVIFSLSKIGSNPITLTSTNGTSFPNAFQALANISATALSNGTAMVVAYSGNTSRTTAMVVSGLGGATQTYSAPYGFNTVLPSVVGDVTALNSSTVLYTRLDTVSTLTYDAVTGLINETGRIVPSAAGEVVSITALQTPNIAAPNATAAHLYAGWATATDAYTATSVTVSGGIPVLSPVAYLLGFAYNPTNQGSKTHAALSPSRAVALTREFDEASTSYGSSILTLFDTANQTPVVLSRLNISGGLAVTVFTANYSYVTALSPTKILVMSANTASASTILSLVTVSGNTMTLNQSVTYPVLSIGSSDISRLSDTSAVLTYCISTSAVPRVQKITLDGTGTSLIFGTDTAISANTTTYCRIAALSDTRAVAWYASRLALLDVSGTAPFVLQDISGSLTGVDGPGMVSISATSALYFTSGGGNGNFAVVRMSGDTITTSVSAAFFSNASNATVSAAPTTSTTGVIFTSQTGNLSIHTYTISGTVITLSAVVNSTITTSGTTSASILSGAVIAPSVQPYTGAPPTSGVSLLVYRDNLAVAGSTNSYKIQKYQRA